MSTMTKLSRAQAEAALAAVKAQWAHLIEERDHSGHEHDESLTGGALEEHLTTEHFKAERTLARAVERGQTLAEVHAAEHKPQAVYPEPVLVEDYTESGHWAIAWEEGPDEWAYRVNDGGTSEEERVMYAALAEEFGSHVKAPGVAPAKMPADVYAEPIMSFVLGLYPA